MKNHNSMELITISISPKWRKKIDKERGDISRSRYIRKIIEQSLSKSKKIDMCSMEKKFYIQ